MNCVLDAKKFRNEEFRKARKAGNRNDFLETIKRESIVPHTLYKTSICRRQSVARKAEEGLSQG